MWDRPNGRHFYRRSYRSAPPKLIPAIISCQSSCCLIFFGIFLLIGGCIARFVAGDDRPPSPAFDTPFFNESRKDFAKGPRLVGTILMSIGFVMISIALIGFFVAFVLYRNYEKERRISMLSTTGSQAYTSQAFVSSPISGPNYPIQGYQYEPGYRALAQNVVYNSTTEPNAAILQP